MLDLENGELYSVGFFSRSDKKKGYIILMAIMVKCWRYFYGLTVETNNWAFEMKDIIAMESTLSDS